MVYLLYPTQVHREEGLELHLEMASLKRGEARASEKSSVLREEVKALTTKLCETNIKLSETNARLTIAENARLKLEHERRDDM